MNGTKEKTFISTPQPSIRSASELPYSELCSTTRVFNFSAHKCVPLKNPL
jgi:hypothetical protein